MAITGIEVRWARGVVPGTFSEDRRNPYHPSAGGLENTQAYTAPQLARVFDQYSLEGGSRLKTNDYGVGLTREQWLAGVQDYAGWRLNYGTESNALSIGIAIRSDFPAFLPTHFAIGYLTPASGDREEVEEWFDVTTQLRYFVPRNEDSRMEAALDPDNAQQQAWRRLFRSDLLGRVENRHTMFYFGTQRHPAPVDRGPWFPKGISSYPNRRIGGLAA